jgi:pyruvate,water dikinase
LAEVTWEAPLPGGWARDFRLGEWLGDPVTPLFESWLLTRIEDRFHGFYGRLLGIALPEPTHVIVNGWYFYGLNFLPATPRGMLAMMVRHVLPRLVVHPRRTAIAFPPLARFAVGTYDAMWHDELQPRYREQARAAAAEVEVASGERLIALVDELADAAGDVFGVVTAVGGYASKAEVPLARFHASHLAATIGGSHLDLLEGLGSAPPELAPHAVRTIDWIEPTLAEAGGPAVGAMAPELHAAAMARRLAAEDRARRALAASPKRLRQFDRLLAVAQQSAATREGLVAEWTLPWPTMRQAVLRLAADLAAHGAIERPADVWFLRRDELVAASNGETSIDPSTLAERRHAWQAQRRMTPPLRIGAMPPLMKSLFESAERAIRGGAKISSRDVAVVVGIPASGGRASGPVRVIRSIDDADRLRPGDVLVAPMTAPAWTPLFDRAVAIVTDTGGAASHASIVAREYGLPAIVGTGDATRRLRDGEIVEVDGSVGIVRRKR